MPILDVQLCWSIGHVPARAVDDAAVDAVMRRHGLPHYVEIAGVLYVPVHGADAAALQRTRDRAVLLTQTVCRCQSGRHEQAPLPDL